MPKNISFHFPEITDFMGSRGYREVPSSARSHSCINKYQRTRHHRFSYAPGCGRAGEVYFWTRESTSACVLSCLSSIVYRTPRSTCTCNNEPLFRGTSQKLTSRRETTERTQSRRRADRLFQEISNAVMCGTDPVTHATQCQWPKAKHTSGERQDISRLLGFANTLG